jgi:hypothetical protein
MGAVSASVGGFMSSRILANVPVSWKTTTTGIIAGLMVILPEVQALLDTDPTTVPDWNLVVAGVAVIFGFAAARDGDKSSQDVGVRR